MALKKLTKKTDTTTPETPTAPKAKKVSLVAPPEPALGETPKAKKLAKTMAGDKAKTPKAAKPSRNISKGQFLGRHMRISEYQDYTLSINGKARKTDEELCADWQTQFPDAVTFTPHHVKGVRRDYNRGFHSKAFAGKKTGDAVSVAYVKEGTKRVPVSPAEKKTAA